MPLNESFPTSRRLTSRRLAIGSVIFGIFVIFDLILFGWLIFSSLSQRELEKALLETREEVEPLARELELQAESLGQEDLWVVVSVTEETQTYIDSVLSERQLVRKIQIRDRDGTVVFEQNKDGESTETGGLDLRPGPEMIELPIGEMGTLVVGLSEQEVARRIEDLRRDLTRQTSLIGAFSITLLGAAFIVIWWLFRRAGRLEQQAQEAERMAYVGTLASGLAHEIRNPLNSLNLNMQMLEEEVREATGGHSGSHERLVSITRSEIKRLEGLVTDFLSYAKPRPMQLEKTSATDLFRRLCEVLDGEIREHQAEIEIDDQAPQLTVRIDQAQVSQLLLNLTKNALAASAGMDRTPRLVLRARPEPAVGKAAFLVLEVADNGRGITQEEQEKIFDLFYSTRKGGTGLGLAIAQRIAQSHDGSLHAESEPDEGTTISLKLPL